MPNVPTSGAEEVYVAAACLDASSLFADGLAEGHCPGAHGDAGVYLDEAMPCH